LRRYFKKELSEHEVALLVEPLGAQGVIVISGAKITYDLSQAGA
jgi:hypothetical protein